MSTLLSTTPLVIVDGVSIDHVGANPSLVGAVATSRFDDLMIDEVERIDVLRGPASAALFGPGAASGVIFITTTRAHGGPWRSRSRLEAGVIQERGTAYPANYAMMGTNAVSGATQACPIVSQTQGVCVPGQLNRWNPLEQASPFRTGQELGASSSLNGELGATGIAVAVGASGHRVRGVTPDDEVSRSAAHLDLSREIGTGGSLGATVTYNRRWTALPVRGGVQTPNDVIANGLFGNAVDDSAHGYRFGTPIYNPTAENAEHVALSARGSRQLTRWLKLDVIGGRDRTRLDASRHDPAGSFGTFFSASASRLVFGNLGAGLEATGVLRGVGVTSSLSYDDRRSRLNERDSSGIGGSFNASWYWPNQHYRAFTWRERGAWGNSLFINAGVSWNADGVVKQLLRAPYTEVDASWRPDRLLGMRGVRLRVARGVAGADGTYGPFGLSVFPNLPNLPPPRSIQDRERTQQTEAGFDAPLRHGGLTATYYHTLTRHMHLPYFCAGICPPPVSNASMKSTGLELSLRQHLFADRPLQWDLTGTLATNRSRVLSLGFSQFLAGQNTRIALGRPFNGYWGHTLSYNDDNHDGLISSSEIHGSSDWVYLGPSSPSLETAVRSDLRYGPWTLGLVLDHGGGFKRLNGNAYLRCARLVCRGSQDPSASLEEQALARSASVFGDAGPFVQNASFVRLQEARLRWTGARSGGNATGFFNRLAVSAIARNLAMWTPYAGIDPEISTPSAPTPSEEFAQTPIPLRLLLRVELGAPLP